MGITREDVINCYRYILGREPESDAVIEAHLHWFKSLVELRKNFLNCNEFVKTWGVLAQYGNVFYFYNTAVGDLTNYIVKYAKNNLSPTLGTVTNCFGVKIKTDFFPSILAGCENTVEGLPIPANWHTDIAEIGSILRAVELSGDTFNIIELGCGWGAWLNIAGKVAKDSGKKIHLFGVEGDIEHLKMAEESLPMNGFVSDEYTLIEGIAAAESGWALFPQQDTSSWGKQPIFDADEKDIEGYTQQGYSKMRKITMEQIIEEKTDRIDLLHIDIQGEEENLILNSLDFLNKHVAMIFIGTHSRTIEGNIIEFLSDNGWILEVERPAIIHVGNNIFTRVDGCELWRNPALIKD